MVTNEWRRTVDLYVDECLSARTSPRASELAARLQVSASGLTRAFRRSVGGTISDYIKERQIERAKRLLAGEATLDDIAAASGFGTSRTFFRAFRFRTGLTPAEYRRREKNVRGASVRP